MSALHSTWEALGWTRLLMSFTCLQVGRNVLPNCRPHHERVSHYLLHQQHLPFTLQSVACCHTQMLRNSIDTLATCNKCLQDPYKLPTWHGKMHDHRAWQVCAGLSSSVKSSCLVWAYIGIYAGKVVSNDRCIVRHACLMAWAETYLDVDTHTFTTANFTTGLCVALQRYTTVHIRDVGLSSIISPDMT